MTTSTASGILDWTSPTECRLRKFDNGVIVTKNDPLVPATMLEEFRLRNGQFITAEVVMKRPRKRSGRPRGEARPVVDSIVEVEGISPDEYANRKSFDQLTAIDPQPRISLEYPGCPPSCRLIDLFCPIGFGTRGLIVAPPKAGKTILLQNIAYGIKHQHPDVELVALLIDERPEEVTDFRRNVPAEVLASSNDQDTNAHIELGMLAIERARCKLEAGRDVVVLLDP